MALDPASTVALLLTGGLASGKTTVAIEAGEALEAAGIPVAVIDLDWLCWAWSPALGDDGVHALLCDNLRAVLPHLLARGLHHLVLARAAITVEDVDALREAIAPAPLHVVLLTATDDEIVRRLRDRDRGAQLEEHLALRASFQQLVAAAAPDARVVDTTRRDAPTVAADILTTLGWTASGRKPTP